AGDADVAARGDRGAGARARAGDRGYDRHPDRLERAHHLVAASLVVESVLLGLELPELRDVRPRNEGFSTRAGEDHGAHVSFTVHGLADLRESLVHAPGHRV